MMENKLAWFDRMNTPKTKTYKHFVKEMENTSPELFFRDGERKFTEKEKKFMEIYTSRENTIIQDSAITEKPIFKKY